MPSLTSIDFIRRDRRAALAGLGTSGSILAAVVAVALLVGGAVAFSAWPDGPAGPSASAVALPPVAPPAVAQAADLLAAAAAAAAAADAGATAAGVGVAAGAGERDGASTRGGPAVPPGQVSVGTVGSGTVVGGVANAAPEGAAVEQPGGNTVGALADVARGAGESLGTGVEDGGRVTADDLAPLQPEVAAAVQKSTEVTGAAVAKTGDVVAGVVGTLAPKR